MKSYFVIFKSFFWIQLVSHVFHASGFSGGFSGSEFCNQCLGFLGTKFRQVLEVAAIFSILRICYFFPYKKPFFRNHEYDETEFFSEVQRKYFLLFERVIFTI